MFNASKMTALGGFVLNSRFLRYTEAKDRAIRSSMKASVYLARSLMVVGPPCALNRGLHIGGVTGGAAPW
jgi:hypothetical protein